ncbi:20501_t:CDS:2, partial [Rhizophagus irregularis]
GCCAELCIIRLNALKWAAAAKVEVLSIGNSSSACVTNLICVYANLKIYLYLEIVDLPNCNDDVTDVDRQRKENEMENVGMNHNDDVTDIDRQGKENEMENIGMNRNDDATDVDKNKMENIGMNCNDDVTDIDGQEKENEMENIWIDKNEI